MIKISLDEAAFKRLVEGEEVRITGISGGGDRETVGIVLQDVGFVEMVTALQVAIAKRPEKK